MEHWTALHEAATASDTRSRNQSMWHGYCALQLKSCPTILRSLFFEQFCHLQKIVVLIFTRVVVIHPVAAAPLFKAIDGIILVPGSKLRRVGSVPPAVTTSVVTCLQMCITVDHCMEVFSEQKMIFFCNWFWFWFIDPAFFFPGIFGKSCSSAVVGSPHVCYLGGGLLLQLLLAICKSCRLWLACEILVCAIIS